MWVEVVWGSTGYEASQIYDYFTKDEHVLLDYCDLKSSDTVLLAVNEENSHVHK